MALRKSAISNDSDRRLKYSHWAHALNAANLHISVREEEIGAAANAYQEVAEHLAENLSLPSGSNIDPLQGSVSTKTLIRSPNGGEKFDIDAVCQVDISRVEATNPMGFFESIGQALEDLKAEAKRRCWNIPFTGRSFYLEFTPSVPLATVPPQILKRYGSSLSCSEICENRTCRSGYPTKSWKPPTLLV